MNKKILHSFLLACVSLTCANFAHAQQAVSPIPQVTDGWRVSVSPYAWLPTVNTTDSVGAGSKTVDISLHDILTNLKSGMMITGEVHYGKWGLALDFANAVVSKSGTFYPVGTPTQISDKATLQASLFNAMGTYTVFNNQNAYVDAMAGVRWIGLTTSFDLRVTDDPSLASNPSSAVSATYGVVGVNSRYRIMNSNWYVPLYADVGTAGGSNHQTWQASAGVGVALSKLVDVSLTYRAVGFDIKTGNSDSTLIKGLFHGPQLMATFNF